MEAHRKEGIISARAVLPLLANHVEWVNSYLLEEDPEYVGRVWELIGEVCTAALLEEEGMEDEQMDGGVTGQKGMQDGKGGQAGTDQKDSGGSEDDDNDEEHTSLPLTLRGILEMHRPSNTYKPCWYKSTVLGAASISELPLGWNVEYRMHEGMPTHRVDKTTAEHRGASYVECVVTDPTTGQTYDLKKAHRYFPTTIPATSSTVATVCAVSSTLAKNNRTRNSSKSSSSSSSSSSSEDENERGAPLLTAGAAGVVVGIRAVPLKERQWWLARYGRNVIPGSVWQMLGGGGEAEEEE